jgi:hypothetical protein
LETAQPARAANLVADLLVPAAQAAVTGALVGTLATLSLVALDFPVPPAHVWVGATLLITTAAWLILLAEHRQLLWKMETLLNHDLDGDGLTGDPAKRILEVELYAGHSAVFVGSDFLGLDDDQLLAFATGVTRGQGLSEGTWAKNRSAFPKGINEFRAFRGRLHDAGLIRPVNPDALNLGFELTPPGRAVFRRLTEYALTQSHEGETHEGRYIESH